MAVISGSQLPVQVRAAAVHDEHHEHAGRGGEQGRGRLQRGGGGHRGSAANRLIGEVVQSQRRPLLGPSPG